MDQKYIVALVINNFVFAALKITDQDFIYIFLNFLSYLVTFAIIFVRLVKFSQPPQKTESEEEQWAFIDEERTRVAYMNVIAFYNGLVSKVTQADSIVHFVYNFKFVIIAYALSVVGSIMSLKTTVCVLVNLLCLVKLIEGKTQKNAGEEFRKQYVIMESKVTELAKKIPRYEKVKTE